MIDRTPTEAPRTIAHRLLQDFIDGRDLPKDLPDDGAHKLARTHARNRAEMIIHHARLSRQDRNHSVPASLIPLVWRFKKNRGTQ